MENQQLNIKLAIETCQDMKNMFLFAGEAIITVCHLNFLSSTGQKLGVWIFSVIIWY